MAAPKTIHSNPASIKEVASPTPLPSEASIPHLKDPKPRIQDSALDVLDTGVEQTIRGRYTLEVTPETGAAVLRVPFLGLFTGALYPTAQVHAGAFYRQTVGLVGPEPGDWVEFVEKESEADDEPVVAIQRNRDISEIFVLDENQKAPVEEEQVHDSAELEVLMEQLQRVQQLLKKSEIKRHEALQDLEVNNSRNDKREQELRAKIQAQETTNKQIRARLSQIHEERDCLVQILEKAQGTLAGVLPEMARSGEHIDDLSKTVETHKTDLRLLEKQLKVTSKERDAVLRRMEELQRDVNDIESLLEIVDKSRELVSEGGSCDYAEKIQKANACIQVLQQYLLKPTGSRHLSAIREVGNRVVVMFERVMVELKRGFLQASKYMKQLEDSESKLLSVSQDELKLASQLKELQADYERLDAAKASIEQTLEAQKETLAETQENLDGTSRQETELRGAMENLTCEKDTLAAMMHSIQREVSDIEGLAGIMEETRQLITKIGVKEMGLQHIGLLDNCLNRLQQHHLKPTEPYDHVSRDISDRLVNVFEHLLTQTKQSVIKSAEAKAVLQRVETDLEGALSEETSLSVTIDQLRSQLNDVMTAKTSLSNDVQMLRNELEEKTDALEQSRMELAGYDEAREAQNKEIENLYTELDEKKRLLTISKQTEIDMTDALQGISEERDVLQSKLEMNEEDLRGLKSQLEEILAEGQKAQAELDALQAEKSNLETQLTGLKHRIGEFESENSRLNAVAQTLRYNLDHERREKEQLEQEAEDLTAARSEMHEHYMGEIETLKDRLVNAQGDCKKLKETCEALEEAKTKLEKCLDEENARYNEQMDLLKKQYAGDAILTGSANSDPLPPVDEPSPFAVHDPLGESASAGMEQEARGSGEIVPEAEGSVVLHPEDEEEAEEEGDFPKPAESKVLRWLDEAEVDQRSGIDADRTLAATAPPYEQDSAELLGSLMPAARPICDRKVHRRLSWPQDMTFALNDNLLGAAQELVEMTTATLELAAEKNQLESELSEVRGCINETRAQLEEREAEVSDLTEHFLQVYQIASDLAADNEEQSTELRELRIQHKRQEQDIECRDQRIAILEREFAMINRAPPRSTIMTNHFAEDPADFPHLLSSESKPSAFSNTEYDNGNGRLRSISSLGFQPTKGLGSPRFEAPGTPSMVSTVHEAAAQRTQSRQTMTSLATPNFDDRDGGASPHASFSDVSSLSSAGDYCNETRYPDVHHEPLDVNGLAYN